MSKIRYIVVKNGSGYPHHLFINLSELEEFTLSELISSLLGVAKSEFEVVGRGMATRHLTVKERKCTRVT